MSKKKSTKKKEERKRKKKSPKRDFFKADWNDSVYVQRTIAQKGRIGGSRLG